MKSVDLVDTGIISKHKSSVFMKYCLKNGIRTVDMFIEFYNSNNKYGRKALEKDGLVDLFKYMYDGIISEEYINILNKEFNRIDKYSLENIKEKYKKEYNYIRRLGLTPDEAKSFIYFIGNCENKKIINCVNEFLESKISHLYIGAYSEIIFHNKMVVIFNLYKDYLNKNLSMEQDIKQLKQQRDKLEMIKKEIELLRRNLDIIESNVYKKKCLIDKLIK